MINRINFLGKNKICDNNAPHNNNKGPALEQKSSALISNTLKKALGSDQVNFKGLNAAYALSKEDLGMIDLIGKIYKLKPEDIEFIQKHTVDYLRRKGVINLSELYNDDPLEYANNTENYREVICKKLGLGDIESMDLDLLITSHICCGDISAEPDTYKTFRYTKDTAPFLELTKKFDIDVLVGYMIFDNFKDLADSYNYDSIFDIFSKDNIDKRKNEIQEILYRFFEDNSTETVNNIMFELYNLSKKTHEERIDGINQNRMTESTLDWTNTLIIAGELADNYGLEISEELLELINARKTNTLLHKDGKPLQEVAFRIADTYNLPPGADKKIIELMQKNNDNTFNETKINSLINTLLAKM